jgi:phenylpropionate dioxygenase-like ring-hydroxylating dioxygenase large terminal subunit
MSSLAAALDVLGERATRPLDHARALPGACYTNEELYALEVEHIFRKEWMCVAREEQLPQPGDWIARDLVGEPLVITRDASGHLHALSRVCAHRAQDLLNEVDERRGNASRLTCPYHSWTYRLDGSCIGAPDMSEAAEFDPAACALGRFPLATWHGFVFVNLDPGAAPLSEITSGVDAVLGDVDLTEWKIARTLPWGEQPVNWKVVIDNGVECYHHMGTHRSTLEPMYPHASVDVEVSQDDHWIAGHMVISEAFAAGEENGRRRHPLFFREPAAGMSALQQSETLVTGIFPMFFFALSPDFCTWFEWYPTGPHSHQVDLHLLVPPTAYAQPDREAVLDEIAGVLNAIQAEDVRNNIGVQRSLHSRYATGGPLSRLEYPLWRFQRYLAQRLTGRAL